MGVSGPVICISANFSGAVTKIVGVVAAEEYVLKRISSGNSPTTSGVIDGMSAHPPMINTRPTKALVRSP